MKKLWLYIFCVVFVSETSAQIYQFRGPDRDGKFPESNLLKEWPEGGPELLLEFEGIGEGWSSVISDGLYIYASGKDGRMDQLSCIDFEGNLIWQVPYGKSWDQSYPSTRGTLVTSLPLRRKNVPEARGCTDGLFPARFVVFPEIVFLHGLRISLRHSQRKAH